MSRQRRVRATGPAEFGDAREPNQGPSGDARESNQEPSGGGRPRSLGWLGSLGLGARAVVAGGREGWLRAGLTALGVGLGVALLLLAASVPAAWEARQERVERVQIRWDQYAAPEGGKVLVYPYDLEFRDRWVRGVRIWPVAPDAPLPPGVTAYPGHGEMVVSPALAALLDSPRGELLRPRLNYPVAGIIGDDGLWHPHEVAFFLGDDTLTAQDRFRIDQFGMGYVDQQSLPPLLVLLLAVGLVVLLLPVAMFVGVALRFAGEQRDRRLAAVRLAGADARMLRWIAAGETLFAAALGLLVGGALFLVGRELAEQVEVFGTGAFSADLRPHPGLLAVVVLGVPAAAVGATLLAMRRLVVEPLGVARQARGGPRRRLWWRVVLPLVGLALLGNVLVKDLTTDVGIGGLSDPVYQVAAGVGLVLVGVGGLLPWLVDTVVRRWRGHGPVTWLLAVRRLQLSGGSTGRTVNGIAVAVAGAIALQMFFSGLQGDFVETWPEYTDRDPAAVFLDDHGDTVAAEVSDRYAASPGVQSVAALRAVTADRARVVIARCPDLLALADLDSCTDGDVFLGADSGVAPGRQLRFEDVDEEETSDTPVDGGEDDGAGPPAAVWQVPDNARPTTLHPHPLGEQPQVLATPGAGVPDATVHFLRVELWLDPHDPDAIEHVRNTTWLLEPGRGVSHWRPVSEDSQFRTVRLGLLLGLVLTLALVGLSLLVGTVEQLRERRRQLAVLVAFGTQRRTLAWSVLWQTAIPMLLGVPLALVAGLGLGAVLLRLGNQPAVVDWPYLATVGGAATGAVLLVTVLALPVLWRLMRPAGLRSE